jgi:hypothetical protein
MITTKIEKLQQMANFEGDVRDGNIGSFSQCLCILGSYEAKMFK